MAEQDAPRKRRPRVTQESIDRKLGIRCEECGNTQWEITHTRASYHRVVRYRRCRVCGATTRTVEFVDSK